MHTTYSTPAGAIKAGISVILDRIAAEDAAWSRASAFRRRIREGHRCLVVDRDFDLAVVPLCDLTAAELDAA